MGRMILILVTALSGCGDDDAAPADGGAMDARGIDARVAMDAPAGGDTGELPDAAADVAAPVDAPAGGIGQPCSTDADCEGMNAQCLIAMSGDYWPAWPGGYCSRSMCTFGSDECGPGAGCTAFPGRGPRCFVVCTTSADCRMTEGYTCQLHPALMDGMYCLPSRDAG